MKKISISDIVLWILAGISVILIVLFFAGEQVEEATTTGGIQTTWAQTDLFLYWVYALIAIGVVALIIFAIKTLITDFQQDAKGALMSIATVVVFVLVIAGCYLVSNAEAFTRVVNGETEAYSAVEMKVVDMWINAIVVLIGAAVVLMIGGGIKNALKK